MHLNVGATSHKIEEEEVVHQNVLQKKKNPVVNIKMFGKQLEQVSVIRFLGTWMDTKLNFRIHIQKMVAKSNTFNEVFGRS